MRSGMHTDAQKPGATKTIQELEIRERELIPQHDVVSPGAISGLGRGDLTSVFEGLGEQTQKVTASIWWAMLT